MENPLLVHYYLQFPAGLGSLVSRFLTSDVHVSRTVFSDDSSVVIESSALPETVAPLPYVKNAFLVLTQAQRALLPTAVPGLIRALGQPGALRLAPRGRGFRTMTQLDGELIGLPRDLRARLESALAAATSSRVQLRGSGEEYWLIGRRDYPHLLLCLRLPRPKPEKMRKGMLAPDLSYALVRASAPEPLDTFLDPFGGSGALVQARAGFPAKSLIYSDLRAGALRDDLPPALRRDRRVRFLAEDAKLLPSVPDGSISAIVTDPPWGEFEAVEEPYDAFARNLAETFRRVLNPGVGRLVLLAARRLEDTYCSALEGRGIVLDRQLHILVNGHPASVLVGSG